MVVCLLAVAVSGMCQSDDEGEYVHFYPRELTRQQMPMPLRYVREADVVWETMTWRTIDLRERFNQFFYFPIERDGVEGRINFAYLLWNAIVNDQIPIYSDDECKQPIDNQFFVKQMTRGDTLQLEIIDDDENYEYKTIIVPREFSSENILQIYLKEAWYIEKQSTAQWVRTLSLALVHEKIRTVGDESISLGMVPLFWIPMQSPSVRKLLHRHEALLENNSAHLPSWLTIFDYRRYNTFVTRESNRFNREIMSYAMGEDALLEAERIDNMLLDIESDMWEF